MLLHFDGKLMEVIVNMLLKANDDLVVSKVNVKVLDGAAPVNLSLPTGGHEQDRTCISGLKAQQKVEKDKRVRVPIDKTQTVDDDPSK